MARNKRRLKNSNPPLPVEKISRWPKLTRALSAAKRVLARELLPANFSSGRRKILATGAAYFASGGAIGALAAKLAHSKSQLHMNEVTISLSKHTSAADVEHARRAIEAAKTAGTPFHAIGVENATGKKGQLPRFLELYRQLAALHKRRVQEHIGNGMSKKEAEQRTYNDALEDYRQDKQEYPEYRAAIDFLSYSTGLPLIPIEEYSPEEIRKMEESESAAYKLLGAAIQLKSNLEEQKEAIEAAERLHASYIRLRNERILQTVPKVASLLRKHYPLMRGKSLRLLYTLGSAHSSTMFINHREADVQLSLNTGYKMLTPLINQKLIDNPEAILSEAEKCRLVLANHLLATLRNGFLITDASGQRERLVSSLAQATEKDFAELNEKTAGKSVEEKGKIIHKYLLESGK